ncbi:MAG: hypothetical protein OXC66_11805 [Roseovarius sp.]|nr:hypothetical protein [Roseovarius sp.]
MDNTPDTRALEHQLALVKKDMEIMKADLSATLEGFRTDAEKREKQAVQREKENQRWMIGLFIATVVILGIIIRWPTPPV